MNTILKISVLEILVGFAVLFGGASNGSGVNHDATASRLILVDPQPLGFGLVPRGPTVQEELIRLQEQTGLLLVTTENFETLSVDFRRRALKKIEGTYGTGVLSQDAAEVAFSYFSGVLPTHLGISRFDGSNFRQYPNFESPTYMCWSYDGTMLSIFSSNNNTPAQLFGLQIWFLKSNKTLHFSDRGSLTSQCWSPNGKQVVYEADGVIKVYDVEKNVSQELGQGQMPTWSPDGDWIAFLDHDTYYVIHPNGQEKRQLFRRKGASSALWWSPDCRFGAYVAIAGMFAGGLTLDVENYRLRVRRLSDNSDEWVANSAGGSEYQWLTNPQLLRRAESEPASH